MRRVLIKELIIYIVIFVILSILLHPDLLENFSDRFDSMLRRENFFHPLIYTFIVYIFILIIRFFSRKIAVFIKKFRK